MADGYLLDLLFMVDGYLLDSNFLLGKLINGTVYLAISSTAQTLLLTFSI